MGAPASRLDILFSELKRRHLSRAVVMYALGSQPASALREAEGELVLGIRIPARPSTTSSLA